MSESYDVAGWSLWSFSYEPGVLVEIYLMEFNEAEHLMQARLFLSRPRKIKFFGLSDRSICAGIKVNRNSDLVSVVIDLERGQIVIEDALDFQMLKY
jgi:hypothetical protein